MSDVTLLLQKAGEGKDPKAEEELLNAVYNQLRIIARAKMKGERPGQTLQATILVHDAWLKICPAGQPINFANRAHFFWAAARAMRQIQVDHARQRLAIKRGEGQHQTELGETEIAAFQLKAADELVEAVDEVLKEIYETDKITAQLVELKYFCGQTL